jgi:hypothetical protein
MQQKLLTRHHSYTRLPFSMEARAEAKQGCFDFDVSLDVSHASCDR